MYIDHLVGDSLGKIEEVDLDNGENEWGKYMIITVKLNISKPIVRKKKLKLGRLEPVWIWLSYERLQDFCFCCGVLGHGQA